MKVLIDGIKAQSKFQIQLRLTYCFDIMGSKGLVVNFLQLNLLFLLNLCLQNRPIFITEQYRILIIEYEKRGT